MDTWIISHHLYNWYTSLSHILDIGVTTYDHWLHPYFVQRSTKFLTSVVYMGWRCVQVAEWMSRFVLVSQSIKRNSVPKGNSVKLFNIHFVPSIRSSISMRLLNVPVICLLYWPCFLNVEKQLKVVAFVICSGLGYVAHFSDHVVTVICLPSAQSTSREGHTFWAFILIAQIRHTMWLLNNPFPSIGHYTTK